MSNQLVTITVNPNALLPDNTQWKHRMKIPSASSNREYIVSQNKSTGGWGCSCPGWIIHRNCKHLKALGLPADGKRFDVRLQIASGAGR
jgi:hypothetical protein